MKKLNNKGFVPVQIFVITALMSSMVTAGAMNKGTAGWKKDGERMKCRMKGNTDAVCNLISPKREVKP